MAMGGGKARCCLGWQGKMGRVDDCRLVYRLAHKASSWEANIRLASRGCSGSEVVTWVLILTAGERDMQSDAADAVCVA